MFYTTEWHKYLRISHQNEENVNKIQIIVKQRFHYELKIGL